MKHMVRCLNPVAITLVAVAGLSLTPISHVRADVVGRLRLHVENAADGQPLSGVRIVISDTARVRPSWTLVTDKRGNALSLPLENRNWQIVWVTLPRSETSVPPRFPDAVNPPLPVRGEASNPGKGGASSLPTYAAKGRNTEANGITVALSGFAPSQREIRIVADTTTEATLRIDVPNARLAHTAGAGKQVFGNQVGTVTRRDQAFIQTFPANAGNPQSLERILQTAPGSSDKGTRR